MKKRTALLRKLKEVFRRYQSQPVDRVVQLINPVLRGWVNYFAVGHSSECFGFIRDWGKPNIRVASRKVVYLTCWVSTSKSRVVR
jgi:RNA-directed DNA polymerase